MSSVSQPMIEFFFLTLHVKVGGIRGRRFSSGDILFNFDSVFGLTLVQFISFGFSLVLVLLVWFGFGFVKVKVKTKWSIHALHSCTYHV